MTVTRAEYRRARAAAPPLDSQGDAYHWATRVSTWELFQEHGQEIADGLHEILGRDPDARRWMARHGEALLDLLLLAYPPKDGAGRNP